MEGTLPVGAQPRQARQAQSRPTLCAFITVRRALARFWCLSGDSQCHGIGASEPTRSPSPAAVRALAGLRANCAAWRVGAPGQSAGRAVRCNGTTWMPCASSTGRAMGKRWAAKRASPHMQADAQVVIGRS